MTTKNSRNRRVSPKRHRGAVEERVENRMASRIAALQAAKRALFDAGGLILISEPECVYLFRAVECVDRLLEASQRRAVRDQLRVVQGGAS